MLKIIPIALLLTACASTSIAPPPSNDPVTVRVNVFRGSSNIPIYMAMEKGYFARLGITPVLEFTPNSVQQREGLAAKHDVVIVAGGDGGMNEMLVRQDINSPADLRGRTYVVDAPNTAYALMGRKILKNAGLVDGKDYKIDPLGASEARTKGLDTPAGAATLLNPPWNFLAKERGAKSLGMTTALYGPYQAAGIFVMRPWAAKNPATLQRYITAYIEGCRAAQAPDQRELTLKVLERELKVDRRIAELTYAELTKTGSGLSKDCGLDMQGFRNVLALRAEIEGQWGGKAPEPEKFLDLSFYNKAIAQAKP
jgi:ABC-type nitrate/sulfonate/bicarbonate transport system substrate-binding protein